VCGEAVPPALTGGNHGGQCAAAGRYDAVSVARLQGPTMPANRRQFLAQTAALAPWPLLASAAAPAPGAPAALHALLARYWDDTARQSPEWATYRGNHRYGHLFTDWSPEGVAARDQQVLRWLAEAEAIAPEGLDLPDRLSRSTFIHNLRTQQRTMGFEGWRTMGLGSAWGMHTALAGLLQAAPMNTPEQAEQLLARLAAYPRVVDQQLARLARSMALGWVTAQPVLQRSLQQLDGQLSQPARSGPYFEPFRRLGRTMADAQRSDFQARGEAAIVQHVLPAQQRVRDFLVQRYLPAAPAAGGLGRYPGGDAVYAALVEQHTTTTLSVRQVHDMGLAQLDRLHAEFARLRGEMKLTGDFAAQVAALRQPAWFYPDPEAMLAGYRAMAKRLDPEMPRLFARLPRTPFGIRPMPAHLGPGAADNYNGPPDDGSGPGWYNANVHAFGRRPRWALATLVAHETVPGHHLQTALARELTDLPAFRRNQQYTAFGEGWALYAEQLMDELGFYDTPEERFGHLQAQAMRAARLVVDTGLHAMGWSRDRAVALMADRVGESPVFVGAEVDRYLSNPGQALAYMVGQQHILGLRREAQAALGPRFDARRFNNAVVDQGALPLPVLSEQIRLWLARQG
jgi:uncharacterized protein (DUF885 family)